MHVLFGASPGTGVSVVSPTMLVVTTPSRSTAGTVDVRVSTAVDSVVLEGAFTFVAPTPSPGPTTPTTVAPVTTTTRPAAPVTTTTGPAPPVTTTTRPGGVTTPTTQPAVTTTTLPGPTTTTTRPPATPARWFSFGSVATTRGTLQLRPLSGFSPLSSYPPSTWAARRCTTDPCPGLRL
jgi:hypothetical protein